MTATLPFNRVGAHFDPRPAELPLLPASARERGQLWSDTVFQAVAALRRQLTHTDTMIVAAAANSILELERTRMRHGKLVAGSEVVSTAQLEYEADERRDEERTAERRAARAAEPDDEVEGLPSDGTRSNEQALAEHAAELAEKSEEKGHHLPGGAAAFVGWQLKRWNLAATAIPKRGFVAHLLKHGVGDEPAKPVARAATPAVG